MYTVESSEKQGMPSNKLVLESLFVCVSDYHHRCYSLGRQERMI